MKLKKNFCNYMLSELKSLSLTELKAKLIFLGATKIKINEPTWISNYLHVIKLPNRIEPKSHITFHSNKPITLKMLEEIPEPDWRVYEKIEHLQFQINNLNEKLTTTTSDLYDTIGQKLHKHFWQKGLK